MLTSFITFATIRVSQLSGTSVDFPDRLTTLDDLDIVNREVILKVLLTVIAIAAITGGAVALSHTDTPTSYGQAAKGTQTQSLHVVRNYGLSVPANPQATINGKYVQPGSTTAEPLTSSTIVTTFK